MHRYSVGDFVVAPRSGNYGWLAQVADIAHAPEDDQEELSEQLAKGEGNVILRYLRPSGFKEYAAYDAEKLTIVTCEEDLQNIRIPRSGKNKKNAEQAIEEVRGLLRQRAVKDSAEDCLAAPIVHVFAALRAAARNSKSTAQAWDESKEPWARVINDSTARRREQPFAIPMRTATEGAQEPVGPAADNDSSGAATTRSDRRATKRPGALTATGGAGGTLRDDLPATQRNEELSGGSGASAAAAATEPAAKRPRVQVLDRESAPGAPVTAAAGGSSERAPRGATLRPLPSAQDSGTERTEQQHEQQPLRTAPASVPVPAPSTVNAAAATAGPAATPPSAPAQGVAQAAVEGPKPLATAPTAAEGPVVAAAPPTALGALGAPVKVKRAPAGGRPPLALTPGVPAAVQAPPDGAVAPSQGTAHSSGDLGQAPKRSHSSGDLGQAPKSVPERPETSDEVDDDVVITAEVKYGARAGTRSAAARRQISPRSAGTCEGTGEGAVPDGGGGGHAALAAGGGRAAVQAGAGGAAAAVGLTAPPLPKGRRSGPVGEAAAGSQVVEAVGAPAAEEGVAVTVAPLAAADRSMADGTGKPAQQGPLVASGAHAAATSRSRERALSPPGSSPEEQFKEGATATAAATLTSPGAALDGTAPELLPSTADGVAGSTQTQGRGAGARASGSLGSWAAFDAALRSGTPSGSGTEGVKSQSLGPGQLGQPAPSVVGARPSRGVAADRCTGTGASAPRPASGLSVIPTGAAAAAPAGACRLRAPGRVLHALETGPSESYYGGELPPERSREALRSLRTAGCGRLFGPFLASTEPPRSAAQRAVFLRLRELCSYNSHLAQKSSFGKRCKRSLISAGAWDDAEEEKMLAAMAPEPAPSPTPPLEQVDAEADAGLAPEDSGKKRRRAAETGSGVACGGGDALGTAAVAVEAGGPGPGPGPSGLDSGVKPAAAAATAGPIAQPPSPRATSKPSADTALDETDLFEDMPLRKIVDVRARVHAPPGAGGRASGGSCGGAVAAAAAGSAAASQAPGGGIKLGGVPISSLVDLKGAMSGSRPKPAAAPSAAATAARPPATEKPRMLEQAAATLRRAPGEVPATAVGPHAPHAQPAAASAAAAAKPSEPPKPAQRAHPTAPSAAPSSRSRLYLWFRKMIPPESAVVRVVEDVFRDPGNMPTLHVDYAPNRRCICIAFHRAEDAAHLQERLQAEGGALLQQMTAPVDNVKVTVVGPGEEPASPWTAEPSPEPQPPVQPHAPQPRAQFQAPQPSQPQPKGPAPPQAPRPGQPHPKAPAPPAKHLPGAQPPLAGGRAAGEGGGAGAPPSGATLPPALVPKATAVLPAASRPPVAKLPARPAPKAAAAPAATLPTSASTAAGQAAGKGVQQPVPPPVTAVAAPPAPPMRVPTGAVMAPAAITAEPQGRARSGSSTDGSLGHVPSVPYMPASASYLPPYLPAYTAAGPGYPLYDKEPSDEPPWLRYSPTRAQEEEEKKRKEKKETEEEEKKKRERSPQRQEDTPEQRRQEKKPELRRREDTQQELRQQLQDWQKQKELQKQQQMQREARGPAQGPTREREQARKQVQERGRGPARERQRVGGRSRSRSKERLARRDRDAPASRRSAWDDGAGRGGTNAGDSRERAGVVGGSLAAHTQSTSAPRAAADKVRGAAGGVAERAAGAGAAGEAAAAGGSSDAGAVHARQGPGASQRGSKGPHDARERERDRGHQRDRERQQGADRAVDRARAAAHPDRDRDRDRGSERDRGSGRDRALDRDKDREHDRDRVLDRDAGGPRSVQWEGQEGQRWVDSRGCDKDGRGSSQLWEAERASGRERDDFDRDRDPGRAAEAQGRRESDRSRDSGRDRGGRGGMLPRSPGDDNDAYRSSERGSGLGGRRSPPPPQPGRSDEPRRSPQRPLSSSGQHPRSRSPAEEVSRESGSTTGTQHPSASGRETGASSGGTGPGEAPPPPSTCSAQGENAAAAGAAAPGAAAGPFLASSGSTSISTGQVLVASAPSLQVLLPVAGSSSGQPPAQTVLSVAAAGAGAGVSAGGIMPFAAPPGEMYVLVPMSALQQGLLSPAALMPLTGFQAVVAPALPVGVVGGGSMAAPGPPAALANVGGPLYPRQQEQQQLPVQQMAPALPVQPGLPAQQPTQVGLREQQGFGLGMLQQPVDAGLGEEVGKEPQRFEESVAGQQHPAEFGPGAGSAGSGGVLAAAAAAVPQNVAAQRVELPSPFEAAAGAAGDASGADVAARGGAAGPQQVTPHPSGGAEDLQQLLLGIPPEKLEALTQAVQAMGVLGDTA